MRRLHARVRDAFSLVRLQPFDTSTTAGRSRERYRRAGLTTLTSVAVHLSGLVSVFVTVPLTVSYLGTECYGLWMTVSSLLSMLSFADLGLGNGLLNAISEAHGRDDRGAARGHVSSAFAMLVVTGGALLAALVASYPFVPWARLFNVGSESATRASGPVVAVCVLCFALNMPLGVALRAQLGYQEGFTSNIWTAIGNLLGLGGVLIAIAVRADLPWIVGASAGAPTISLLANAMVLFGISRPWLRPAWSHVSRASALRLLRIGSLFVLLQLAAALAFASDNIIAAQVLGPAAVAEYAITARLFIIAPTLVTFVLAPLWPAYGEAIARGDHVWVRRALSRSLWVALGITGGTSMLLVAFGGPILRIWVGSAIRPSSGLLLGLGVVSVLLSVGSALAVFLNGLGAIRVQVACGLVMALAALAAKSFLVGTVGLSGIPWGTAVAYTAFAVVPLSFYVPRLLANMEKGPTTSAAPA